MITGILLGSFDPIHIGHMSLAITALNGKLVDEVVIVPAWHNPWKEKQPEDFYKRFEMCCLAFNKVDKVHICDIEKHKYIDTYEVINHLKEEYPDNDYKIIMSVETFNELKLWNRGLDILHENSFIIIGNSNIDWRVSAKKEIIKDFNYINISSTKVREMIKNKEQIVPWVPKEVALYIKQNNLYK